MTVQEVARKVMKTTGTSQQRVAEIAGLGGQGTIGMYLNSKSMRVDSLLTILNACDYELVARDRNGKLAEYIIGKEREPRESEVTDVSADESALKALIRKVIREELEKM